MTCYNRHFTAFTARKREEKGNPPCMVPINLCLPLFPSQYDILCVHYHNMVSHINSWVVDWLGLALEQL